MQGEGFSLNLIGEVGLPGLLLNLSTDLLGCLLIVTLPHLILDTTIKIWIRTYRHRMPSQRIPSKNSDFTG